jgi:hypothetical protein
LTLADDERALLLSDDRDAERLVVVDPDRLILLTTWDYLHQLEEAQRIQSADAVIEAVRQAGRNPSLRDLWSRPIQKSATRRRLSSVALSPAGARRNSRLSRASASDYPAGRIATSLTSSATKGSNSAKLASKRRVNSRAVSS